MKSFQSFLISIVLLSGTVQYISAQQSMSEQKPQSNTQQKKEVPSVLKKALKWFGAIGFAAVSTVVLYQGVQYGHGKYIETMYEDNPKYKIFENAWNDAIQAQVSPEHKVAFVLSKTSSPEDVELAQKFFQAKGGYIFVRSRMVQEEVKARKLLLEVTQSWPPADTSKWKHTIRELNKAFGEQEQEKQH